MVVFLNRELGEGSTWYEEVEQTEEGNDEASQQEHPILG